MGLGWWVVSIRLPVSLHKILLTSRLLYTNKFSSYHLHCWNYCNTIARLLRKIRRPPPTPFVYAIHHTILVMAISCKGQAASEQSETRRRNWVGLSSRAVHLYTKGSEQAMGLGCWVVSCGVAKGSP